MGLRFFDGSNYSFWSVQMRLILQERCLWSLIDGRYKQPPHGTEAWLAWEDKRDRALATILLAMSYSLQASYISETDPTKLWATLAEKYGDHAAPTASTAPTALTEPTELTEPIEHVSLQSLEIASANDIRTNDWIIGVNNSAHVTPRRDLFTKYTKYALGQKKIQMTGTDQILAAHGYGTVTLRFQGPDGAQKLLTIEALFAPKCDHNLLAVGKLEKSMAFEQEGWALSNEDGTDFAAGSIVAGVPVLHTDANEVDLMQQRRMKYHRGPFRHPNRRQPRPNSNTEGHHTNGSLAQSGSA